MQEVQPVLVLRALGCAKLELMVRDSNEGVISFYQGQGYEQGDSEGDRS